MSQAFGPNDPDLAMLETESDEVGTPFRLEALRTVITRH